LRWFLVFDGDDSLSPTSSSTWTFITPPPNPLLLVPPRLDLGLTGDGSELSTSPSSPLRLISCLFPSGAVRGRAASGGGSRSLDLPVTGRRGNVGIVGDTFGERRESEDLLPLLRPGEVCVGETDELACTCVGDLWRRGGGRGGLFEGESSVIRARVGTCKLGILLG